MVYPSYIDEILSRLESSGEEAYIVGGSVRDSLLGIPPNDFDIATSALPEKTLSVFSDRRVIETGLKHGTVTVIADGNPVEITTFRIDGGYSDSRHPDKVSFTSRIEEDLSRRDFTVNAMAYGRKQGLVDCFGGKNDLDRRIIRAVREPVLRFSEDALRIMRAFRFSAQLGFDIDEHTLLGAKQTKDGLTNIARERICVEFIKLISSRAPESSLKLMEENGILKYVCGDFTPSSTAISALCLMQSEDFARLGVFFYGASKEDISDILRSLKCSNRQKTGALAVARGASFCVDSPQAAARLTALTGDYAVYAARASYLLGNSPENAEALVRSSRAPSKISELKITGRDVMALGYSGKEVGAVLEYLLEHTIADPDLNEKDKLLEIARTKKNSEE